MVDPRLIAYVRQVRQQGYTDEQIRAGLLQQNYPESLIKAALASANEPTLADSKLLQGYVKTYLQQGYSREQITAGLAQQGYAEKDIARAFREATGGHQERPKMPLSMILFPLLALIILSGGIFVVTTIDFTTEQPLPPPTTSDTRLSDIIENLIPLASRNPTAAVALCNRVIESDRGRCFITVGREANDPSICADIPDVGLRDSCYLKFIHDGNLEFCDRLELPDNIIFCDAVNNIVETTPA